ncbi:hypothetical protein [Ralstonia solanacearum]|uniref:hypothetical protein n=1 Tax=Ralstonia solanacearum TaxID=305 RepID=UPI001E4623E7|nr:hypothetical protein [Ralstonia solanacearum]
MSKPAVITIRIGIASVALPMAMLALAYLLRSTIPGCACDEGAGCSGCGPMGEWIAFGLFGGFIGTWLAAIIALPVTLALAGFFYLADLRKKYGPNARKH